MIVNVGNTERLLRVLVGVILIALVLVAPTTSPYDLAAMASVRLT